MSKETKLYFLLDTLEFLQKGGRIGKAAALFGSLLNIKPILTVDQDGEVASVDKIRGHKKAMGRIIELLKVDFVNQPVHIGIAHSEARGEAEALAELIQKSFDVKSEVYTALGPVIGTHTGPGAIAVFMRPAGGHD
jgi:DegV family protein with EDD domain